MTRKREDELVDETLGFPVKLQDVPMRKSRGEWVPDYDPNEFQRRVLRVLARSSRPLTGNQVRFVRLWLEETQQQFAESLDVTHSAVSQWEGRENAATGMKKGTEALIRCRILSALPEATSEEALERVIEFEPNRRPHTLEVALPDSSGNVEASA